ncbi:homoserine dehydrogenase [bacterium]|nr:homoserine dehydrogenase [bacterium]
MRVNLGLIGFGTVGSGVVKLLRENHDLIGKKTGINLYLKKIVDKDISSDRRIEVDSKILTTDVETIFSDPEISIVIELIGGEEPAKSYIVKALTRKKHVITANKILMAKYGEEISGIAKDNNVQIQYEASVAGGIPLLNALREGLVANKIRAILGIINGTTNYILTRMNENEQSFEEALKDAKRKGYAETNPAFDIEGIDSSQKLVILSSLAFGTRVDVGDVYTEGISKITIQDIKFAREFGYIIKLLAIAKNTNEDIELRVHPTMIPLKHPLASVRDEYNAICIEGDAVGTTMFYGKGAGQMPTASSVVSDIIKIALSINNTILYPNLSWDTKKIRPIEEMISRYYLRFPIIDQPGVIGKIGTILGKHDISITSADASLVEKQKNEGNVEILTHETKERNIRSALGN